MSKGVRDAIAGSDVLRDATGDLACPASADASQSLVCVCCRLSQLSSRLVPGWAGCSANTVSLIFSGGSERNSAAVHNFTRSHQFNAGWRIAHSIKWTED